jgi:hypothetical protein
MKKKLTLKKIKITELSEEDSMNIKGATGGCNVRPTDSTSYDWGCDNGVDPNVGGGRVLTPGGYKPFGNTIYKTVGCVKNKDTSPNTGNISTRRCVDTSQRATMPGYDCQYSES